MDVKAVYFLRNNPKGVQDKTVEQDVLCGEIVGSALASFRALLSELYLPILEAQKSWGKNSEEHTAEFLAGLTKFSETLTEAASSLEGGLDLRKPDEKHMTSISVKPSGFNTAANDPKIANYFEGILQEWCTQVDKLLEEGEKQIEKSSKQADDLGPDTELEFWRGRMAKFNSITEQLKGDDCKLVLGVCMAARSAAHRNWKVIDMKVTDAGNEAKDNVKYLTTLEKSLEPMYLDTPEVVIDSLPALMNNIKMMHTIARYYNTPERMTTLFCKITNQMINNCKTHVLAAGQLWNQDKPSLLVNLELCLSLNQGYQEQYKLTRDRLMSQPKGKQFDFNEGKIFSKFDLFCKRVSKLLDMFTTIHQFSILSQHTHIDGLEEITSSFFKIVDDFRRKPYDLMDYTRNAFDRDYLEFNVNIHDLETTLQAFINNSFENISSTDQALNLLRQFQGILQRDTLKADLDDKYLVIFQNYGLDLDAVQKLYEKHKHSPHLVRDAPPVAGNIMWSRQLLRRIEEPMKKFSKDKGITLSKESRRIVKTYNRVASTLIEFEMLWYQGWVKSIEGSKAGLQASLLVRQPQTGRLVVNFDKEILQLLRETRYLQRMGVTVPEGARMVALQSDRFKRYFNELTDMVKKYTALMNSLSPEIQVVLAPHVDDLERKLSPGLYILTWTSMNIDNYIARVTGGLTALSDLWSQVNDLLTNRIQANLREVSESILLDLPSDRSFNFEDFVSHQNKFLQSKTQALVVRNQEVERGVKELLGVIKAFPRENSDMILPEEAITDFTKHYETEMYQAVLTSTRRTFDKMKRRLGSRSSGGFLFVERPFFEVDIELCIPEVSLNPSLEDIQASIISCAKLLLKVSSSIEMWGQSDVGGKKRTFHEVIAKDKEVMKVLLLLTGSIKGLKNQVWTYIDGFNKYSVLWKKDLQKEYQTFMETGPTLEMFEAELKKYMAFEMEIAQISPVHNIGALSLETQPMKNSLRSAAATWKAQFAQNLHKQGHNDLKKMIDYMRETSLKLNRKVEDLEDVRTAMGVLKEVREREGEIDSLMVPVEEIYALLGRYEVRVTKEETDMVGDLRYSWKKLRKLATDITDNLTCLQVGFKRELLKEVKVFITDVVAFRQNFDENGPMVEGLEPTEAVDRLKKFQQLFEVRKRKWTNYSSGEELFGLPVTEYPELERTEKEITLLDRLYSLYVTVINTINGYGDFFWVDVQAQIDQMSETVMTYQAQCKKLPKSLRGWQVDKSKMLEMFSQQSECVKFIKVDAYGHMEDNPVFAQGNIEVWLQSLVDGMQTAVKGIIKKAHAVVSEMPLEDFVFGHPAQISLLGIQFMWTTDMQNGLTMAKNDKSIMNKTLKKVDAMLREMIVITCRDTLVKNQRTNLETCITVHVHQRDTSDELVKKKI
eukprot:gene2070-2767_t